MRRVMIGLVVLAGTAAAEPVPDDAERCKQIGKTIAGATNMRALVAALVDGSHHGVTMGEREETKSSVISFCVLVDPPLAVAPCLKPLGLTRPIVHRALTKTEKWSIANNLPRRGQPLAMRLPRIGPAAITPTIAAPPRGKRKRGSPAKLPFHELDRKRDTVIEICLVDRKFGE